MKYLFNFAFLILFPIITHGQSVDRFVISPLGGNFVGANAQIDWTIGQPFTYTSLDQIILTQGFHQPEINTVSLFSNSPNKVAQIYPNPFQSYLNIYWENFPFSGSIIITDITGKQLLYKNISHVFSEKLDLSAFPSGTYLVQITSVSGFSETHKCVIFN